MANRWRIELDKWMKDEERNVCSMKYTMKGRTMSVSFLDDLLFFNIELNGDAQVVKVETADDDLQGFWIDSMKEFLLASPQPLLKFLEKASETYLNKEDGEKTASAAKHVDQEAIFEQMEPTSAASNGDEDVDLDDMKDEFDEMILETPGTQRQRDLQRAQMNKFLEQQVQKTVAKLDFDDFVKNASGNTLDNWKDKQKADKDVYVRFFNDQIFTIDDGPPRLRGDPNEKKILESFAKGFVPRELCGDAQDVDLHVLHIDKTYKEYTEEKQMETQVKEEDEDEAFKAILEQVKQESLAQQQQVEDPKHPHKPADVKQPQQQPQKSTPVQQPAAPKPKPKFVYKLDEKKPVTNIQFRFENNTKAVQKFNLHDKVEVLYKFAESHESSPDTGFVLCIPPKQELNDRNATLDSMNLQNAALLVKKI